jgi:hypothetical protein
MPTKNTIVVPCMVKSWLNTWGETKLIVGDGKLDAHQHRFDARNQEENESVPDVHQPDLFVIDGGDPVVQEIEHEAAGRVRDLFGGRGVGCHRDSLPYST